MSDMTPNQIEAALAEDRLALARSLAALRERLDPSALLAGGKAALRAQALPLLSALDQAVRARPIAAAVAGVALAALVLGRSRAVAQDPAQGASALTGTRFEALTRWEDEGGPPMAEPVDPDEEWLTDALDMHACASDLYDRIDAAGRRGLAPVAQLAAHRAEVAAALARDTARALGRGLEMLTGAAHAQALATRERLYRSRLAVAANRVGNTVADHPIAAGAAMLVAGAAAACLFPQTEAEDRLMGETRDRLVEDMRQALRDEAIRASAFGRAITDALKTDLAVVTGVASGRAGQGAGRP